MNEKRKTSKFRFAYIIPVLMLLVGIAYWLVVKDTVTSLTNFAPLWVGSAVLGAIVVFLAILLLSLKQINPSGISSLRKKSLMLGIVYLLPAFAGIFYTAALIWESVTQRPIEIFRLILGLLFFFYALFMFLISLQFFFSEKVSPTKSPLVPFLAIIPFGLESVLLALRNPSSLYRITSTLHMVGFILAILWLSSLIHSFYVALHFKRMRSFYVLGMLLFLFCTCFGAVRIFTKMHQLDTLSLSELAETFVLPTLGLAGGATSLWIAFCGSKEISIAESEDEFLFELNTRMLPETNKTDVPLDEIPPFAAATLEPIPMADVAQLPAEDGIAASFGEASPEEEINDMPLFAEEGAAQTLDESDSYVEPFIGFDQDSGKLTDEALFLDIDIPKPALAEQEPYDLFFDNHTDENLFSENALPNLAPTQSIREQVDNEQLDIEQLNGEQLDSEQLDSEQLDSEQLDSEQTAKEQAQRESDWRASVESYYAFNNNTDPLGDSDLVQPSQSSLQTAALLGLYEPDVMPADHQTPPLSTTYEGSVMAGFPEDGSVQSTSFADEQPQPFAFTESEEQAPPNDEIAIDNPLFKYPQPFDFTESEEQAPPNNEITVGNQLFEYPQPFAFTDNNEQILPSGEVAVDNQQYGQPPFAFTESTEQLLPSGEIALDNQQYGQPPFAFTDNNEQILPSGEFALDNQLYEQQPFAFTESTEQILPSGEFALDNQQYGQPPFAFTESTEQLLPSGEFALDNQQYEQQPFAFTDNNEQILPSGEFALDNQQYGQPPFASTDNNEQILPSGEFALDNQQYGQPPFAFTESTEQILPSGEFALDNQLYEQQPFAFTESNEQILPSGGVAVDNQQYGQPPFALTDNNEQILPSGGVAVDNQQYEQQPFASTDNNEQILPSGEFALDNQQYGQPPFALTDNNEQILPSGEFALDNQQYGQPPFALTDNNEQILPSGEIALDNQQYGQPPFALTDNNEQILPSGEIALDNQQYGQPPFAFTDNNEQILPSGEFALDNQQYGQPPFAFTESNEQTLPSGGIPTYNQLYERPPYAPYSKDTEVAFSESVYNEPPPALPSGNDMKTFEITNEEPIQASLFPDSYQPPAQQDMFAEGYKYDSKLDIFGEEKGIASQNFPEAVRDEQQTQANLFPDSYQPPAQQDMFAEGYKYDSKLNIFGDAETEEADFAPQAKHQGSVHDSYRLQGESFAEKQASNPDIFKTGGTEPRGIPTQQDDVFAPIAANAGGLSNEAEGLASQPSQEDLFAKQQQAAAQENYHYQREKYFAEMQRQASLADDFGRSQQTSEGFDAQRQPQQTDFQTSYQLQKEKYFAERQRKASQPNDFGGTAPSNNQFPPSQQRSFYDSGQPPQQWDNFAVDLPPQAPKYQSQAFQAQQATPSLEYPPFPPSRIEPPVYQLPIPHSSQTVNLKVDEILAKLKQDSPTKKWDGQTPDHQDRPHGKTIFKKKP